MKPLGIILIILVLAAIVGFGYLDLNARIDVLFKECIATDAMTQLDYFDSLKAKVNRRPLSAPASAAKGLRRLTSISS